MNAQVFRDRRHAGRVLAQEGNDIDGRPPPPPALRRAWELPNRLRKPGPPCRVRIRWTAEPAVSCRKTSQCVHQRGGPADG